MKLWSISTSSVRARVGVAVAPSQLPWARVSPSASGPAIWECTVRVRVPSRTALPTSGLASVPVP